MHGYFFPPVTNVTTFSVVCIHKIDYYNAKREGREDTKKKRGKLQGNYKMYANYNKKVP